MRKLWWRFLRLFFRLLYNEFAWTYDLVAWTVSLGQWRAWGRTAIPHLRGERVLELAHGPGHLMVAMARQGLSPVGVDLSPAMSCIARRRLRRNELSVPQVRADARALPFRDGYFSSVVSTFPTEFIIHLATLSEVARVTQPRARLVVVAWARLGGQSWLHQFIRWLYRVTGQGQPEHGAGRSELEAAGFDVDMVKEHVKQSEVSLAIAEKRETG